MNRLPPALRGFFLALIILATLSRSAPAQSDACRFEGVPLTLDRLSDLNPAQLERLFRQSRPGPVPGGKVRGKVVRYDGLLPFPLLVAGLANGLWSGKIFYPQNTTTRIMNSTSRTIVSSLHNIVLGIRMFKGLVYKDASWLEHDGRDAWIIDYTETASEIGWIRDEFRHVGCGIYLGWTFDRSGGRKGRQFILNFAIDINSVPKE